MPSDGTANAASRTKFGAEPLALTWKQPSGLIGLSLINFVLRVLTLGVYHFWGKTEVRRRIWSAMRLNGEPLEYTGTGKELFIGFLVVFFAIFLPVTLIALAVMYTFGPQSGAVATFQILAYVAFFFLIGFGIHRALRYRLSRTRWRGIRGGLEGSSLRYAWTYFWTALLIPFTLGWIMPWRSTKLQAAICNDMRFGNRPFRFTARSGPLYGRFAIAWIGSLVVFGVATAIVVAAGLAMRPPPGVKAQPDPALVGLMVAVLIAAYIIFGVIIAWYQAATINHFAAHTGYEGATFKGNATAGSLIWLAISNLLIVILTLGLLAPVAQVRAARYMVNRLSISGAVPLAEIEQRANDPMRRGEGLAQVFDVDAF
jgi:uncharacterized membrane protein YjgN (DUF898 family)